MEAVRVSCVCSEVLRTEPMASNLVLAWDNELEPDEHADDLAADAAWEIGTVDVRTRKD